MDYEYPLDYTWSTEDMVAVVNFYSMVEKAYESGIKRDEFITGYRHFKDVVDSKSEEKKLDKAFQDVSGYSIYKAVQASKDESEWIKLG